MGLNSLQNGSKNKCFDKNEVTSVHEICSLQFMGSSVCMRIQSQCFLNCWSDAKPFGYYSNYSPLSVIPNQLMNHSIVNVNAFILTAMFSAILANWTAKFSEHLNRQLNTNVTNKVTMMTKDKPEGRRDPEVIQVDPVEPGTPGKMMFRLCFISHLFATLYYQESSLGKRLIVRDANTALVSPRNERAHKIHTHYPDLRACASDWTKQVFSQSGSTTQIWVVTYHQYRISAFIPQMSFLGERQKWCRETSAFFFSLLACYWLKRRGKRLEMEREGEVFPALSLSPSHPLPSQHPRRPRGR